MKMERKILNRKSSVPHPRTQKSRDCGVKYND
jgi:hypothetical protein